MNVDKKRPDDKLKPGRPPVRAIYRALYRHWGPQHWWPGRTRLEVVVGAILTQNTAWTNVEKAMARLRREKALNLSVLHRVELNTLAEWIRPAGYYNVKARRLRAFTRMVDKEFDGRLERLWKLEDRVLRDTLLRVHGIGPETADSIMLYAAGRPFFVVDAYTRRFLGRHGWITDRATYDEVARWFTDVLPRDVPVYNEYHALIVRLGKTTCRRRPLCDRCPLKRWLPESGDGG